MKTKTNIKAGGVAIGHNPAILRDRIKHQGWRLRRPGLGLAGLALALLASFAQATDIRVTTASDVVRTDGNISLREAVEAVNRRARYYDAPAGNGNDTISLPYKRYYLTGPLVIRRSVKIVGDRSRPTIDGQSKINLMVIETPLPNEDLTVALSWIRLVNSYYSAVFVKRNASLSMYRCDVTDTQAVGDPSAGIFNKDGYCYLDTCTLANNTGVPRGGAVFNSPEGWIIIRKSTISDNRTTTGAGILNNGYLNLENCTLSGNVSTLRGGGLYNSSSGYAYIDSCTIAFNENTGGLHGGGINNGTGGDVNLVNTILANNRSGSGPDCYGTIWTLGHNLVGSPRDATIADVYGDPVDLVGVDPLLDPLGAYGGTTRTHRLRYGSPALDRGSLYPPNTDQRGYPRPRDGDFNGVAFADIGAFEYQP